MLTTSQCTFPAAGPCRAAAAAALVLTLTLPLGARTQGQAPSQPAPARQAAASQPTPQRVRVPTSYANVHMGPSSGQEVLVLVPRGTELTVVGRDKEWLQVELTPEMRKTGMLMRWYKNETRGWMHDSTVEAVAAKPATPVAPRND
jgi:hypothetical protein